MKEEQLKLLRQAITNEVEGYAFYKMAANNSKSEESKQTLLALAKEEEKHAEWLKDLMDKLQINKVDQFEMSALEGDHSPKIFKWDHVQDKDPSQALAVFKIALQMEKSSAEFYEEGAKKTDDATIQKLFSILAEWEWGHYHTFNDEYQNMLKDFWADQSYAPY
ncbi:ferritin-like domain-containing protein [Guggenheimella bovis]